ncbi:MAG: histidine kinase [Flavobacteriaceae bacterium]|nr:MAG: histidine kinase [Flavobacteriaceae bacterium]
MPLYLDLHELPDGVTAAHVAEMHQADLAIEHKYNCRGLTYWCDEKRQSAFCLIDAPNKQALIDLHEHAHGAVPTNIIEVNDTIVESFLGRIEDPEKSQNTSLNIINDPAFRILVVLTIKQISLDPKTSDSLQAAIGSYTTSIESLTEQHNGSLIKHEAHTYLMSFEHVTDAVHCGSAIRKVYNASLSPTLEFNIGISAGVPVTEKEGFFENTITTSTYLSDVVKGAIAITTAIKDLYESENQNKPLGDKAIRVLSSKDEAFMMQLMSCTEGIWSNTATSVNDFEEHLGYSKSKLYRTMVNLVGKSPNIFLREYRLEKALELLEKQHDNVSEIAYQTGFSSPAYFSKCFQKKYGVLPSGFIKNK